MSDRIKYKKNSFIKIFRIIEKRYANNPKKPVVVKQYIHPQNEFLKAYIRQLTATEVYNALHKETSAYLVVINYHPEVDTECYVEYGDMIMKVVTPPDDYELRRIETKLTCQRVSEELGWTKVIGGKLK